MTVSVLAFFSGVGVSLVAALVAHLLTRQRERQRIVEERRFEIYMKLLDLHAWYFWFTTAEMHREPLSRDVRLKCRDLSWQIADKLRSADEVEELETILDVLLGPEFITAMERYEALAQLLTRLGRRVNPRYAKKIRQISEANMRHLVAGTESNAPGSTRLL